MRPTSIWMSMKTSRTPVFRALKSKCGRFLKLTSTAPYGLSNFMCWRYNWANSLSFQCQFLKLLENVKRYFYTDGMWVEQNRLFLVSVRWGEAKLKPRHLFSSLSALWQSSHCTWFQKVLWKKHKLAAIFPRFKSLRFFSVGIFKSRVY